MSIKPLLDLRMTLAEGPVYDELHNRLYWVDIPEGRLWQYDFATGTAKDEVLGSSLGMAVPHKKGGMVAALKDEIIWVKDGLRTVLVDEAEPDAPNNRFNDGKCDAKGRLLAGSMDNNGKEGRGSLYILEEGQPLRQLIPSVSISNGIGFSPDNRYLYYVDTPSGFLCRYRYDVDTGSVSDKTALIDYRAERGNFDGICMDAEGCIWAAHWDGYQVSRWDPRTGQKMGMIDVPAPYVTSCCFGGPNMDQLFITTAAGWDEGLKREYPLSGSVFVAQPGVKGPPVARFGK